MPHPEMMFQEMNRQDAHRPCSCYKDTIFFRKIQLQDALGCILSVEVDTVWNLDDGESGFQDCPLRFFRSMRDGYV